MLRHSSRSIANSVELLDTKLNTLSAIKFIYILNTQQNVHFSDNQRVFSAFGHSFASHCQRVSPFQFEKHFDSHGLCSVDHFDGHVLNLRKWNYWTIFKCNLRFFFVSFIGIVDVHINLVNGKNL